MSSSGEGLLTAPAQPRSRGRSETLVAMSGWLRVGQWDSALSWRKLLQTFPEATHALGRGTAWGISTLLSLAMWVLLMKWPVLPLFCLPAPVKTWVGPLGIFIYEAKCFLSGQKLLLDPNTPQNDFSPRVGCLGNDNYTVTGDWLGCFCSDSGTRTNSSLSPALQWARGGSQGDKENWQGAGRVFSFY